MHGCRLPDQVSVLGYNSAQPQHFRAVCHEVSCDYIIHRTRAITIFWIQSLFPVEVEIETWEERENMKENREKETRRWWKIGAGLSVILKREGWKVNLYGSVVACGPFAPLGAEGIRQVSEVVPLESLGQWCCVSGAADGTGTTTTTGVKRTVYWLMRRRLFPTLPTWTQVTETCTRHAAQQQVSRSLWLTAELKQQALKAVVIWSMNLFASYYLSSVFIQFASDHFMNIYLVLLWGYFCKIRKPLACFVFEKPVWKAVSTTQTSWKYAWEVLKGAFTT